MLLTKHKTTNGSRWAVDGHFLPPSLSLSTLLELPREAMLKVLSNLSKAESAVGEEEAPIDPQQEVWAAGVTYLRSRDARKAESTVADMYQKVYDAERPEIFSKSLGWRVSGNGMPIRIRKDSKWNVPEPELVLIINRYSEIVGYCAGNDVSSRDIEGENPLYLPQAKVYNGSCALGHGILLCEPDAIKDIPIHLEIERANKKIFKGETSTATMKRTLPELTEFLTRELDFPQGVFLMTGTCLVPDGDFTLQPDDVVAIRVGDLKIGESSGTPGYCRIILDKRKARRMTQTLDHAKLLNDLSPYVYGTTRLGDAQIPFEARLKMARTAMDAGIWFHTSHTYGNALEVLRAAFDEDRTKVPKLIVKIGWNSINELRDVISQNIEPLGLDGLELGQLCLNGSLADDFANGGTCYQMFKRIKQEGLVRRFVLEVFPWTSHIALKALRGGYPKGIVDGYIFYLNPLQRFASNELWDLIVEQNEPVVAMRTVSGGPVHRLRDVPGAAWKEYLQQRAVEVAPIFEQSGIKSWTEFCVRFAHSFPQVRATVGSTSQVDRFQEFITAAKDIQPLPKNILDSIVKLQYRWSDELDIHAEQWSM